MFRTSVYARPHCPLTFFSREPDRMSESAQTFSRNYFSRVTRSQPAKPARKQNLTRNSQSRSCILGSLKSRRRTAYRIKVSKKIASENAENCRCRQRHCRLTPHHAPGNLLESDENPQKPYTARN